jgi:hypothetical protein
LGLSNEHIQFDILNSTDVEKMKQCFENIRAKLTSTKTKKETYESVRHINKLYQIKSKRLYFESKLIHPKYINDPKIYFQDRWICWYDFLGVETNQYPKTKIEWIQECKKRCIQTWEDYKNKKDNNLPDNPSELYEDYTNWDKEFGIQDDIVW